jgi:tungstate transport system substrate-binding protein
MIRLAAAFLIWLLLAGCGRQPEPLVLASTTSTEDSGLFDVLLPAFERTHPNYQIKLLAVGSGEALALGRRGDADVLLVHSPAAEAAFMKAGHGSSRRAVMSNDFVLLGDSVDPAGIRGGRDAVVALSRIAQTRARFISRGDQSGTHVKERELWLAAGRDTPGLSARGELREWYVEVGQGMADALRVANETRSYVLSDRGTYLALSGGLRLNVLVEGDPRLRNPYSVIVAQQAKNPVGAEVFAQWITGEEAQERIAGFGRDRFGQPLFFPDSETR